MSLPMWMRISGWLLFVAGGIYYFVSGAELTNRDNLLPWAGAFAMVIGMGLTMGANLVAQVGHMRTLKPPADGADPASKENNG